MSSLADLGDISKGAPRYIKNLARTGGNALTDEGQFLLNEHLFRQNLGRQVAEQGQAVRNMGDTLRAANRRANRAVPDRRTRLMPASHAQDVRTVQVLTPRYEQAINDLSRATMPGNVSRSNTNLVHMGGMRHQPSAPLPPPEPVPTRSRWPYYTAAAAVPAAAGTGYLGHRYWKRRKDRNAKA